MATQAKKNTTCRYCKSKELSLFLSLGEHPPSNSFLKQEEIHLEQRYPLEVYFCKNCSLVQLLDVVPPELIFDDYHYLSSTSKALRNHYEELTDLLSKRFSLRGGECVVDIGCNDGIMLNAYAKQSLVKVGVEPSKVAALARDAGFHIYQDFFSPELAKKIVAEHGKAKIITATNVFPHVDDISTFTDGIPTLLADNGVFVVEASYLLDLIDQKLFDTIYHEHLCYLSLTPMIPFFQAHGLEIFGAEREPIGASGPAIRVYAQKSGGPHKREDSLKALLQEELQWGVQEEQTYLDYAKKIEKLREDVVSLLTKLKADGASIGGYGAPAKGNTLLNYFGITPELIDSIAETNELKQGMLTPGSHIPVVSEEAFLKNMPDYALLLTWNYLEFFLQHSPYIQNGGKFVLPVPEARIVSS